METYDWKQEVRQWINRRRNTTSGLAEEFVRFFELAFEKTRDPQQAWFGAQTSTLSLVVGGIFLAAVVSSGNNRGVWLLVDKEPPSIEGLNYQPVKSTQASSTPLVWIHGWPLETVTTIIETSKIWESYSQASEKIFNSPRISASRDELQERHGKKRLCEFWGPEVPKTKQWDYATFREELERRKGAKARETFDRFHEQSVNVPLIRWHGSSHRIDEHATFWPWIRGKGISSYPPVCFRVDGQVEIPFKWIKTPPFDDEERRSDLQDRLNEIPGIDIKPGAFKGGRPTFSLSALQDDEALDHLLKVFDWYVNKLAWAASLEALRTADLAEPSETVRVLRQAYDILRDTTLARKVKSSHQYKCQICGKAIELSGGQLYAEIHHIRPLGSPHNGPDVSENMLCVCPNHHVQLDYGAIDLSKEELRSAPGHHVGAEYIDYHNTKIFDPAGATSLS